MLSKAKHRIVSQTEEILNRVGFFARRGGLRMTERQKGVAA